MPKMRRAGVAVLLWLVLLTMPAGVALAAAGDLDESFDGDGKRTIDYGGIDSASTLALRPDGRILIGGYGNPLIDFAIQSLLPDGSGDPSFDAEGSLAVGLLGSDLGHAVALQPDGKVLLAGSTSAGTHNDLAIVRRNLDGSPDTGFAPGGPGGEGVQIIDYAGGQDIAHAIALQPDGGIVLVGTGNPKRDVAIQRLLPDGTIPSGASVGINLMGAAVEGIDEGNAVALQPDGKILVAGLTRPAGGDVDLAILRVNPDLSLDKTFAPGGPDGDGIRVIDYSGAHDAAWDLALQPDGRIVIVGQGTLLNANNADVVIQRLMRDGSLDASFGSAGLLAVNLGGYEEGFAVALQPDGKILVAGSTNASGRDFAILRVQPGGSLDTTFAGDGKRLIDFGGQDGAYALTLQPDGRILVAGHGDTTRDVAIARLMGDPPGGGGGGGTGAGGGTGGPGAGVPRCAGKAATIVGTAAADRLRGTRRADVIASLGGNDVIKSGRGKDRVCAGRGNDRVLGNSGNDRLAGQSGKDRLLGATGNDHLNGGAGKDRLTGGQGRDRCLGGPGRDRATCERGGL